MGEPHVVLSPEYDLAVQPWTTIKSWPCGPQPDGDRDAAFAFELLGPDGVHRQATVEFAAPSQVAGLEQARLFLAPFLDSEEPPRRLLVSRRNRVSILEG